MPSRQPADNCLLLVEEMLYWSILDRMHLLETLCEPGCNRVAPLASMFHSGVEQFGIFCIERNNLLYIMGIEGCNPAIHQSRNLLFVEKKSLWTAAIAIRLQVYSLFIQALHYFRLE